MNKDVLILKAVELARKTYWMDPECPCEPTLSHGQEFLYYSPEEVVVEMMSETEEPTKEVYTDEVDKLRAFKKSVIKITNTPLTERSAFLTLHALKELIEDMGYEG